MMIMASRFVNVAPSPKPCKCKDSAAAAAFKQKSSSSSSTVVLLVHCLPPKSRSRRYSCIVATGATKKVMAAVETSSINGGKYDDYCGIQPAEKVEMLKSLEGWAEDNILPLLKPVDSSWQPHDLLPDSSKEEFHDGIEEMRERALEIPDDYYVCLVGNMITEEALPTYQSALNSFIGAEAYGSPSSMGAWAQWSRGWSAEENRHGDLLNRYLYLCGRVDMRHVEKTIHYLIKSGMRLDSDNCPYRGFIYTAFQERATFISHGNTARHAKELGDTNLAKICGVIAADEKRHETAYTKVVEKLFQVTPDTAVRALEDMMRKRIVMPASFMFDGQDHNLFHHYSCVAQRLGVYTTKDYGDLVEFFVKRWAVEKLTSLSAQGRRAQEYVCSLPQRIRKMEERAQERNSIYTKTNKQPPSSVAFSWIFNKQVML